MAHSSILGADRAPAIPPGHDVAALGPSDSSDSGSDMQGLADVDEMQDADSDAEGTGERASVIADEDLRDGGDIAPDRIVDAAEALGPENLRAARLLALAEQEQDAPLDCAEWMDDNSPGEESVP